MLDLLLWRTIAPLIFAFTSYKIINLVDDDGRFVTFVIVLLLLYYTATLFCLSMSALFGSLPIAYVMVTVIMLAVILMGGAFVNVASNDVIEHASRASFIRSDTNRDSYDNPTLITHP